MKNNYKVLQHKQTITQKTRRTKKQKKKQTNKQSLWALKITQLRIEMARNWTSTKTRKKIIQSSIIINGNKSWDWGTYWSMPSNSHSLCEKLGESMFHHQLPFSPAEASCTAWNSELLEIQLCPMDSELQSYKKKRTFRTKVGCEI